MSHRALVTLSCAIAWCVGCDRHGYENPTRDGDEGGDVVDTDSAFEAADGDDSSDDDAPTYNLEPQSSGFCLRPESEVAVAGDRVVQDYCSSKSLVFTEVARDSGIELHILGTSFCINAATTTLADPYGVDLEACNGSNTQLFMPTTYTTDVRSFELDDTGLCLDQLNASTTIGDPLGLWTCSAGDPQKLLAIPPTTTPPPYNLKPQSSGLCLRCEAEVSIEGTRIVQDDCSSASLIFTESVRDNGLELRVFGTGFCVNAVSTTLADPDGISLSACNGSSAQLFIATMYATDVRSFELDDTGLCLDQLNGSTTVGDPLGLWTCDAGEPQKLLATTPSTADITGAINPTRWSE